MVSVLTSGRYIGAQQVVPVDAVIEDGIVEEAGALRWLFCFSLSVAICPVSPFF